MGIHPDHTTGGLDQRRRIKPGRRPHLARLAVREHHVPHWHGMVGRGPPAETGAPIGQLVIAFKEARKVSSRIFCIPGASCRGRLGGEPSTLLLIG